MAGKKIIVRFQNNTGSLENAVKFLENVQKKINFINLTVEVKGKDIIIKLFGTRDLQFLARERLEELAQKFLS